MAFSLCGVRGLDIPCSAHIRTGSQTYEHQRSFHRLMYGRESTNAGAVSSSSRVLTPTAGGVTVEDVCGR
jgi:hypothetical protein